MIIRRMCFAMGAVLFIGTTASTFGFNAALVAIGIVMMAGAIASADAIGL